MTAFEVSKYCSHFIQNESEINYITSKYKKNEFIVLCLKEWTVIYHKNLAFHISFDYFLHWHSLIGDDNKNCYVNSLSGSNTFIFCIKVIHFRRNVLMVSDHKNVIGS